MQPLINEATIDKQECDLDRKVGAERNHIEQFLLFIYSLLRTLSNI